MKILLAALYLALSCLGASAQNYPTKPVRIVVPLSPGGPVDVITRALAVKLSELWGQPVVVDNRPGANEIVGAENVASSKGDGYTLFMATDPSISQINICIPNCRMTHSMHLHRSLEWLWPTWRCLCQPACP